MELVNIDLAVSLISLRIPFHTWNPGSSWQLFHHSGPMAKVSQALVWVLYYYLANKTCSSLTVRACVSCARSPGWEHTQLKHCHGSLSYMVLRAQRAQP